MARKWATQPRPEILDPRPGKDKTATMTGKLCVVATPIGNTQDLSPRAREVLNSADIVACEDTRVFEDLVRRASLTPKKVISYHDHNEAEMVPILIQSLESGQTVALVSDAGTPGVSDPGFRILQSCYERGLPVQALPGPSSVTSALSICPIGGNTFAFLGFAPQKEGERKAALESLRRLRMRAIFFESPHRIRDHLATAQELYPSSKIFLAREISKTYEESLFDTPPRLLELIQGEHERGEFVVIYPTFDQNLSPSELEERIQDHLSTGRRAKEILEILGEQSGLTRSDLYDLIHKIKSKS